MAEKQLAHKLFFRMTFKRSSIDNDRKTEQRYKAWKWPQHLQSILYVHQIELNLIVCWLLFFILLFFTKKHNSDFKLNFAGNL